jgi:hypothetical protein
LPSLVGPQGKYARLHISPDSARYLQFDLSQFLPYRVLHAQTEREGEGGSQREKEKSMNIQENKLLVMQGYQKFNDKDIGALLEMFTDDIEWEGARSEYIPFSGVYHGKQQAAQYFKLLDEAVEAQQFEPQEFIAEGDKVVVFGQSRWTVKANGNTYDSPWAHILTLRNGKVARFQQYYDSAAAVEAFRGYQQSQETGAGPTVRH